MCLWSYSAVWVTKRLGDLTVVMLLAWSWSWPSILRDQRIRPFHPGTVQASPIPWRLSCFQLLVAWIPEYLVLCLYLHLFSIYFYLFSVSSEDKLLMVRDYWEPRLVSQYCLKSICSGCLQCEQGHLLGITAPSGLFSLRKAGAAPVGITVVLL